MKKLLFLFAFVLVTGFTMNAQTGNLNLNISNAQKIERADINMTATDIANVRAQKMAVTNENRKALRTVRSTNNGTNARVLDARVIANLRKKDN